MDCKLFVNYFIRVCRNLHLSLLEIFWVISYLAKLQCLFTGNQFGISKYLGNHSCGTLQIGHGLFNNNKWFMRCLKILVVVGFFLTITMAIWYFYMHLDWNIYTTCDQSTSFVCIQTSKKCLFEVSEDIRTTVVSRYTAGQEVERSILHLGHDS